MTTPRTTNPRALAIAAEAERLYERAAREALDGDETQADATRALAKKAVERAAREMRPAVCRVMRGGDDQRLAEMAVAAKVGEIDRQLWGAALQAEADARAVVHP